MKPSEDVGHGGVQGIEGIEGIGVDIQSISEFEETLGRQGGRFLSKVFTPAEIEYCGKFRKPAQHYAARWAIKEAFYKAVGDHMKEKYHFSDVETRNSPTGKPYLQLYGSIHQFAEANRLTFHISLSHSGNYAIGVVFAQQQIKEEGLTLWD